MPDAGPLPTPRDSQRLTVRFLHAPLDVEHAGDVVTMYDSARRHPGMSNRTLLWTMTTCLAMAALGLSLLPVVRPATSVVMLSAWVSLSLLAATLLFMLAGLPVERRLRIDLRTGAADLRWPDMEFACWKGDVDGLHLYVCPMLARGQPLAITGYASVAVLHGRLTPPKEIEFERGPITTTLLHFARAFTVGNVQLAHTNRGWIVLATGEDPDLLEAELREALPTLTSVIKPQRIDDVLTGPVDAKLLRKPTPRGDA
ncbi:MAG: hypothetical protein RIE32_00535 [Phycisphaerales bacterium]